MKRILLSLATVATVSALAIGATGAFFSDNATNNGNTFTTGTLTLQLDGTDSSGAALNSPFFNVTDLKPGDTKTAYVEVKNNGSLPMWFRTYTEEGTNTVVGLDKFSDQLQVTITLNPSGYTPVLTGSLYGPANTAIVTGVNMTSLLGVANALNNHAADPLAPGFVAVYKVDVSLPTTTTSTWEAATFTGSIQVDAVQSDNNPTFVYP